MSNALMGFMVVMAMALGMTAIALTAGLLGLSHGSRTNSGSKTST